MAFTTKSDKFWPEISLKPPDLVKKQEFQNFLREQGIDSQMFEKAIRSISNGMTLGDYRALKDMNPYSAMKLFLLAGYVTGRLEVGQTIKPPPGADLSDFQKSQLDRFMEDARNFLSAVKITGKVAKTGGKPKKYEVGVKIDGVSIRAKGNEKKGVTEGTVNVEETF